VSTPRFLLDEHVWGGLVDVGQALGADILLVQTQLSTGADDEEVLVSVPAKSEFCSPAMLRISPLWSLIGT
jgi:hypothetical protein